MHETPREDVKKVIHIRRHYRQLLRWMGKSAGHLHTSGMSDRQSRIELPIRTNLERNQLAKERSGSIPTFAPMQPAVLISLDKHSQFRNLRVGASLVHAAKRSRLEASLSEDVSRFEADQCVPEDSPSLGPPVCRVCGTFRKQTFRDEIKCRQLCACDRKAKRRRLSGKQTDRWGYFEDVKATATPVHKKDAKGHLLFIYAKAEISWCINCGAFTGTHLKDLGKQCMGEPGTGKIACLRKLRRGLHPTIGQVLGEAAQRVLVD